MSRVDTVGELIQLVNSINLCNVVGICNVVGNGNMRNNIKMNYKSHSISYLWISN